MMYIHARTFKHTNTRRFDQKHISGACPHHTIKPREKSRNPLELRSYTSLGVTSTSWGTSREPRVSYGFCFAFCFCPCPLYTIRMSEYLQIFFLPGFTHTDDDGRPSRVVTGARASSSWRPGSAREEARDGARRRGGSLVRCDDDERTDARDGTTGRWNDGASEHAWKRFSIGSGDLGGERRTDRTNGFRTNERFGMTTRCVRGESVTTTGTACCLRD